MTRALSVAMFEGEREGVVLDRDSGAYFRVNATAARICAALAVDATTEEVAARAGVPPADVDMVMARVAEVVQRTREPTPVRFERGDELTMWYAGEPVLALDRGGRRVRAVPGARALGHALWCAVPHLLALLGVPPWHASAVVRGGRVTAFTGGTGAGKTTAARAFGAAGADVIADDLVVIASDGGVTLDAERRLRAWAGARAARLSEAWLDTADLIDAIDGPTVPLGRLYALDGRRTGDGGFCSAELSRADGLVVLLDNAFAETEVAAAWDAVWQRAHSLAVGVPVHRLRVPNGVDALRAAASRYSDSVIA